jgi:hypothetical protein
VLALGVIEVGTSALRLGAIVRAVRRVRHGTPGPRSHAHSPGVDWIDVFVAGVLGAEALERWHTHHHIARPTILLAITVLTLGIAHRRIAAFAQRKRSLRVTYNGISIPRRPFGRFTAKWSELDAITIGEREASVRARAGRSRRVDLTDAENGSEVRAALDTARERLDRWTSHVRHANAQGTTTGLA